MTGLRVWLHPSSRTKSSVSSFEFQVSSFVRSQKILPLAAARNSNPETLKLASAPFRRTASVVRNGRHVADRAYFDSRGGQRAHRRFASRPGTADADIDAAHPVIPRHVRGVRRGLLGGERRTFTRSPKAERSRTLPRQNVAIHVSDGHDRVIEGRLHIAQPMRHVLAFLLLEGFLLAFFIRCGCCAARCCWFRHS